MRITHQLLTEKTISDYDLATHSLSRIIDSKIHTVYLKQKTAISDLARLSKLPNEEFMLMAYLQNKKD